jgi:ABC-type transport system substrate-binding protein
MRYIALRWFAGVRTICAVLAVTAAAGGGDSAAAATRPHYGGTLVVELHVPALVLDPTKWKTGAPESAASQQIASAVFERLVTLDRFGRFQPGLATDWSHDEGWRRWQFSLRTGVQFSDGSALTAAEVAAALQELFAERLSEKGVVTAASGTRVILQFSSPMPDLLEQLASGRNFIFRREADGTLLGTGPFFVAEFAPAAGSMATARYKLLPNEKCWAGRPFVDALEVHLGVPALRQLFDLQLGKADVVELSADLVRRAQQENLRVWASAPVLLYGLQVSGEAGGAPRGSTGKADLREALSLALDRATMASVLLQRQAEPAASFLPQWLSGYAFVFGAENNVERAKEIGKRLVGASGAGGAMLQPLKLRVDAGGDLAKLIGERVAINARQAGISVQLQSRAAARENLSSAPANSLRAGEAPALRLIAWRYSSLSQRAELDAITAALQLEAENETSAADAEQVYARERRLLTERDLIPLVVMPEYIGLGAGVHDWMAERWGEWHLADVWLDGKKSVAEGAQP